MCGLSNLFPHVISSGIYQPDAWVWHADIDQQVPIPISHI